MFKVGDKVWSVAKGEGKVTEIWGGSVAYPVMVKFNVLSASEQYTKEGKNLVNDLYPSLFKEEMQVIPRPKKVVKGWVNVYSCAFHDSKEKANKNAHRHAVGEPIYVEQEYYEED